MLPCPLVHAYGASSPVGPVPLHIDTAPSRTHAATLLGCMELGTGRPVLAWDAFFALARKTPFFVRTLALPNVEGEGRLAVFVRSPDAAQEGIPVLLARGPAQHQPGTFFHTTTDQPKAPLIFSPQVYRLVLPTAHSFARPHGGIDHNELPGAHAPDAYHAFARAAESALAAADSIPQVVAPHQAGPNTAIAPWACARHSPAGLAAFLAGALLTRGHTFYGHLVLYGGAMADDGHITPPRPSWKMFLFTGNQHKTLHAGDRRWLIDRLTAPGCPWPPHRLVAQSHPFHTSPHQSTFRAANESTSAALVEVDLSAAHKNTSAHALLAHRHAHDNALTW